MPQHRQRTGNLLYRTFKRRKGMAFFRIAEKGIKPNKVTPLMRLAYVGQRGMGALTYEPAWPEPDRRYPAGSRRKVCVTLATCTPRTPHRTGDRARAVAPKT